MQAFPHICLSRCFKIYVVGKEFGTKYLSTKETKGERRQKEGEDKSICCNAAYSNLPPVQDGLIHSPGAVRDRCGLLENGPGLKRG